MKRVVPFTRLSKFQSRDSILADKYTALEKNVFASKSAPIIFPPETTLATLIASLAVMDNKKGFLACLGKAKTIEKAISNSINAPNIRTDFLLKKWLGVAPARDDV
ncbi:hypothetical protein BCV64_06785 [Cylindrospermopsis raciborskii MVCC14]|nr:hypothetical protein BCV64_06785 [Cylindrospermopsis raciborskii MVCC14]